MSNTPDKNTPEPIDHATFREQIAAALAGGLTTAEQSAFDGHAAGCEACAAELRSARQAEERMTALFAAARPLAGFEDRIIHGLRLSRERRKWLRPNWTIHPAVTKAVTGVAAAIVLAGFGYVATQAIEKQNAQVASVQSPPMSAGVKLDLYNVEVPHQATDESSERISTDDYLKRPIANRGEVKAGKPISGNSQNRYSGTNASGEGWKSNSTLRAEFGFAGDVNPKSTSTANGTLQFGDGHASTVDGISTFGSGTLATGNTGKDGAEKKMRSYFFSDFEGVAGKKPESAGEKWFKPKEVALGLEVNNEGAKANVSDLSGVTQKSKDVKANHGVQFWDADADGKKPANAPAPVMAPALVVAAAPVEAPAAPAPAAPEASAPPAPAPVEQQQANSRKVIRNGNLEFEVERYDAAFAQVSKLTTEAGGYVGTTDSEKLPNGKVKGTVTVRVPPDRLDTLVLQLRGIGDLKSQKLEAQDVSKHYSDMDSELRAARAMEERLLAIIKEGKGQIKDLLAAEKELGNWRTKIEQLTGEMKFLDNQVALSTLNITLYERDIKTPATAFENETIDSGVETEDVEKARADALKTIEDAKGRVIQSDLKRYDAGQFAATIIAEVPAENAGPMLDRLKQLGKMARLDVQRKQTTAENATVAPVRVEKRATRLTLSLYNLANVAPRQTTTINLAADDVEATYRAILARVTKAGGRIVTSNLSRNKPEATTGTISFEVPTGESEAVKTDVQAGGETMKLVVAENPDVQNVTTAKRGYNVALASTASIPPRELATLQVAATDVIAARDKILQAAGSSGIGARVIATQLNANDQQNVNATIELDARRGDSLAKVEKAIAESGQTVSRVVTRATDTENTLDSKVRLQLTLGPAEKLPPREMTTMSVELSDVEAAMGDLVATAQAAGGRTVESNLSKTREGQSTAHVIVDVPLDKAGEVIKRAKDQGAVRAIDSGKNLQMPAGALAKARIDVTFGNAEAIVSPDRGFWSAIRRGLSTSAAGLMWSLQLIVVGLCFVLPWVAIFWVGWRLVKRRRAGAGTATASS